MHYIDSTRVEGYGYIQDHLLNGQLIEGGTELPVSVTLSAPAYEVGLIRVCFSHQTVLISLGRIIRSHLDCPGKSTPFRRLCHLLPFWLYRRQWYLDWKPYRFRGL